MVINLQQQNHKPVEFAASRFCVEFDVGVEGESSHEHRIGPSCAGCRDGSMIVRGEYHGEP